MADTQQQAKQLLTVLRLWCFWLKIDVNGELGLPHIDSKAEVLKLYREQTTPTGTTYERKYWKFTIQTILSCKIRNLKPAYKPLRIATLMLIKGARYFLP